MREPACGRTGRFSAMKEGQAGGEQQWVAVAPQEAYAGPCTAKTTIYCANIAAAMVLAQFAKFLRGVPVEADVHLNLLSRHDRKYYDV